MIARPTRAGAAARFNADGAGSLSQERLLVMLYERLRRDLETARDAIVAGRREPAHVALVHAQEIIGELDGALDHDGWDGAGALSQVYQFLMSRLVAANVAQDAAIVDDCLRIVVPLAEMWDEAWASMTSSLTPAPPATPAAPVVHDGDEGATTSTLDVVG